MRLIKLLLAFLFGLLLAASIRADEGIVSRVIDGDTLELADGRTVDLIGVDAPELNQTHGKVAQRWLELLVKERKVELRHVQDNGWGRVAAVVTWDGSDTAGTLLTLGAAWFDGDKATEGLAGRWASMQAKARKGRKGLWESPAPVAPWEWREGKRVSQTAAQSPSRPVLSQPVVTERVYVEPTYRGPVYTEPIYQGPVYRGPAYTIPSTSYATPVRSFLFGGGPLSAADCVGGT